ncbi:hypothetical protein [Nocardioides mangrovi]|uniref:Uncharacterized protein n=1 Tax=Nocardioides mangrovi TaxID=2874580 RepID=A0ABS7U780_9ACTN|nr:hypothetical protein [Nocardioides mangrovi]MBZ5736841.1 hypothetical protein [Nocardioides mangrovi]
MNTTFWIIAAAVLVVGFALAWWSSGRQRKGLDADGVRRSRGKSEGDVAMKAGRPTGGGFHPGNNSGRF